MNRKNVISFITLNVVNSKFSIIIIHPALHDVDNLIIIIYINKCITFTVLNVQVIYFAYLNINVVCILFVLCMNYEFLFFQKNSVFF